jgi:Bacterial transcriptional activator domain
MLALYRSGRQAEALGTYRQLASGLARELGIDPVREVTWLHQVILRQGLSLDLGHAAPATTARLPAPGDAVSPAISVRIIKTQSERLARTRSPKAGSPEPSALRCRAWQTLAVMRTVPLSSGSSRTTGRTDGYGR